MAQYIDINTDGMVQHTARLERMHRYVLPNAVRETLNSMAFDVKTNTMPREAQKAFVNRKPNFFKAMSRVDVAKGWDIRSMKATVGFINGDQNQAVEDLEKQEKGGIIKGRTFVPVKGARIGKDNRKSVARKNRVSSFGRVVNTRNAKGKNKGQKFIKSVVHAGKGGIVIHNKAVFRVKNLRRVSKSKWNFKLDLIYTYEKGRSIRITKATHFMEKASKKTQKKAEMIYKKEAERQLKRLK
jgi:hypothetical protein